MDQAEASGKTVEDALKAALAQLGARREQVEMTVLDEGKRSLLFGRGGRDAIVRVEWLEGESPEKGDGNGGRRRGGRGRGGRSRDDAGGTTTESRGGRSNGGRGRSAGGSGGQGGGQRSGRTPGGRGARQTTPDGFVETASPKLTEADFLRSNGDSDEGRSAGSGERRESPSRGRARNGRPGGGESRGSGERRERRERRDAEDEPVIEPNIDAEEVDFAAGVVDDLLRILEIDAEISLREPMTPGDGRGSALAVIDISGDDLGVLIGRRGETLLNLQYLVNLMLGQRYPGKGGVTIGAEHYRHRREEEIVSKAMRMAESVKEYGDPITLEPMTPADRRLVHLALAEDEGVVTESTGDGENRKVVILPRD